MRPVRITATFDDLNEAARNAVKDYVRQDELVVTTEANFDPNVRVGQVKHFGQRLGMGEFREFFEADKAGAKASTLAQLCHSIVAFGGSVT